jgi:hypothetical protein
MRRLVLALVPALLIGCSTPSPSSAQLSSPSPTASAEPPPQGAHVIPGGCGSTPLLSGGIPAWVDEAGAHNNPNGLPYVLASSARAAGFIFGYPLSASRQDPSNKILWVVGVPRNGYSLEITGHPLNAHTPVVHVTQAANSFPGEIYPVIVDVPRAGCWHFDLAWAGNKASVDLMYG